MRVKVPALGRGDHVGRSTSEQGMSPEALASELCAFRDIHAGMSVQINLLHKAIAEPLKQLVELTETLVRMARENTARSKELCDRADRLDARGEALLLKGDQMTEQGKCLEHEVKRRADQIEQGGDV